MVGDENLGHVLGICCKPWEVDVLSRMPFESITLSGVTDYGRMKRMAAADPRISFRLENAECMDFGTRSFDLVYCKEGLHHLARPILGFYEMLRVCRRGSIFIEPNHTWLNRLLQALRLASSYERGQWHNISGRDNFVFRFTPDMLVKLLNSYYLESGYRLEIRLGWLSSRFMCNSPDSLRGVFCVAGWIAGRLPGARGNYMTAIVIPGAQLPCDPVTYGTLFRSDEAVEES